MNSSLIRAPPGINPAIYILDKLVHKPTGPVNEVITTVEVRYSEKTDLVWDRILDLNIFPPTIARTEMRFYKAHVNEFGLPLDNRSAYTKLDWEVWTATLADNRGDFDALIAPLTHFINGSPSRINRSPSRVEWIGQRGFPAWRTMRE